MVLWFLMMLALAAPVEVEPSWGDAERTAAARQRIREGDYPGARILLSPLEASEERAYLMGVSYEMEGDPQRACRHYRRAMRRYSEGSFSADLRFRLGEAQGTMGHPRRALKILTPLPLQEAPEDRVKLKLVTGILLIQSGQIELGLDTLQEPLTESPRDLVPFYQAKARATIAKSMLLDAGEIRLVGSEQDQVEALQRRLAMIKRAEQQILEAAQLQQPEWALEGILADGKAYEKLAKDLRNARLPATLTRDQRDIYREVMGEQTRALELRAAEIYTEGVRIGTRYGVTSARIERLEEAAASLATRGITPSP